MAVQVHTVNFARLVISSVVVRLLVLAPVLLASPTRTSAFSYYSSSRRHHNYNHNHRNDDASPSASSLSAPVGGWQRDISGSSVVSLQNNPRDHRRRVPSPFSTTATRRMTASDAVVEDSSASASASAGQGECPRDVVKDSEPHEEEDPYLWLEEVESDASLAFARKANEACLAALGDPTATSTGTYERVLASLESDDRIPHSGKYGRDDDGEEVLYNFWKDGKNPKGIWRRTTLSSFRTDSPNWTTVLDLDELGRHENTSWVWKGARPLPRPRDPPHKGGCDLVNRALLFLSRGGADATVVREFDLTTNDFVDEGGAFNLPEAKTRAGYKSRDVILVGSEFGTPDSLTDSGYPRTVREWVRGTPVEDAPTVFEGEVGDVSVSAYIDDQRNRSDGCLYEVRQRALTFYTSRQWVRKIEPEHLLPPDDPDRVAVAPPPDFVELDIQQDADFDLFGNLLLVSLRSDWTVGGVTFKSGSLIYTEYDSFISAGKDGCTFEALFEPTERTALRTYSATKTFLILSVMDDVKSKLVFFRLDAEAGRGRLINVGGDDEARIRSTHAGCLDSYEGDKFWFTTSGYTQPSTLHLADAGLVSTAGANRDGGGGVDGDGGDARSPVTDDSYVIERLKSLPDQYDSSDVEVVQRMATSKDGTRVPYFVAMKRGMKLDGNTPTLLYGYGGFEISLSPHYIATQGIAWLERGGAYVEANIRGGGEFGPAWHQAALKENRNKSYEDYIAIAEDLCASGMCKPSTLGIRGGSNGGLLMGNMLVMRPDLFGAIHCAVPLLDMKRYHTLLAGASWMAEYGDPSTDDWDDFLYKYSPYHNIDPNADYPPILFTTSTRDDRVHPAHARKMVKKLLDVGKGRWPVYYYENIEGGHGGAADSKQSAFMTSLAYDFLWNTLSKQGSD